jgi:hypothetical protein
VQQQHLPAAGGAGGKYVEGSRRGANLEFVDHPPDSRTGYRRSSVLVEVSVVGGVAVAVVHVVDMIPVLDGLVTAVGAVLMRMIGALGMPGLLAFVVVTLVFTVQMTIVGVVDVIAVLERRVPAVGAVDMVVAGVLRMCCGHRIPLFPGADSWNRDE